MRKGLMSNLAILVLPAFLILAGFSQLAAQEHPEHPDQGQKTFEIDKEKMAKAITDYIQEDARLKGGYFFVYDPDSKSPLQLTLDKVHKARLSQISDDTYFACSDFKEKSGKMFDLDFFMTIEDDKLVVTEVMIHKEDGKPRYVWNENDGIWSRK